MICDDCKAAADFDALPGLAKMRVLLTATDAALAGHDLCAAREARRPPLHPYLVAFGRPAPDCACQHRRPVRA